jgi:hypothetical protein
MPNKINLGLKDIEDMIHEIFTRLNIGIIVITDYISLTESLVIRCLDKKYIVSDGREMNHRFKIQDMDYVYDTIYQDEYIAVVNILVGRVVQEVLGKRIKRISKDILARKEKQNA